MDILQVAQLAKKHGLHSGEIKWPDDELENLFNLVNEAIRVNQQKEKSL